MTTTPSTPSPYAVLTSLEATLQSALQAVRTLQTAGLPAVLQNPEYLEGIQSLVFDAEEDLTSYAAMREREHGPSWTHR